jgi:hypothetical protein
MTNRPQNDDRRDRGGSEYQPLRDDAKANPAKRPSRPEDDGLLVTDEDDEAFDRNREDEARGYTLDRANNPPTPPPAD